MNATTLNIVLLCTYLLCALFQCVVIATTASNTVRILGVVLIIGMVVSIGLKIHDLLKGATKGEK